MNENNNNEDNAMSTQYKLVGVVVHMGTADAGHYLSYINVERGEDPGADPKWMQTEN